MIPSEAGPDDGDTFTQDSVEKTDQSRFVLKVILCVPPPAANVMFDDEITFKNGSASQDVAKINTDTISLINEMQFFIINGFKMRWLF